MSLLFEDSLLVLLGLSADRLDETSRRIRGELADSEWKMGICLLAMVRSGAFRELGYSTISEYGERALNLSGQKVGWLLGAARVLEHCPLLSSAFREGRIGWGKVRAIQSVVTPETERQWLDFALAHSTAEVARKVALSPREWKRQRAFEASLEQNPVASKKAVEVVLNSDGSDQTVPVAESNSNGQVACNRSASVLCSTKSGGSPPVGNGEIPDTAEAQVQVEVQPSLPSPPRLIRLVVELTPDQYALYEQAEHRLQARAGKRLRRAEVVSRMAEQVLESGTARARAKHQVLIHTDDQSGKAWYETGKGVLPVAAEVVEEALGAAEPMRVEPLGPGRKKASDEVVLGKVQESSLSTAGFPPGDLDGFPEGYQESPGRHHIPNATLRALFARAGHRCERCGARGGRLDVHHTTPVSEGGGNSLEELRLYCRACHTLHHEKDLATKPHWRRAYRSALGRAEERGSALDTTAEDSGEIQALGRGP